MKRTIAVATAAAVALCGGSNDALAYVGPGAGVSLVGAFVGLCLAVLAAFGAILFWPLRRLVRRIREARRNREDGDAERGGRTGDGLVARSD